MTRDNHCSLPVNDLNGVSKNKIDKNLNLFKHKIRIYLTKLDENWDNKIF